MRSSSTIKRLPRQRPHAPLSRNPSHCLRLFSSSPLTPENKRLPLSGTKVLDLTRVLAGPYCTQILGDLGAEVLKIEHPTRGDDTRQWGPPYAPHIKGDLAGNSVSGESAYYLSVNRNKSSLALSFSSPRGSSILRSLARKADVFIENYLPGSLKKYGLDYETLRKENPKLVYASITGYGQTGPYSDRGGYDVMVEAEMGLMHITGSRNGPPSKVGVAVTDLTTGLYAVNSIMASLLSRARTGEGQYLDVCLSDCQVATLSNMAQSVLVSGERDGGRWGCGHPSVVPYNTFPTSNGDILFGCGTDRLFVLLCHGLGKPEWATDPLFLTNSLRVANREMLETGIAEVTKKRKTEEWEETFEGTGVPFARVNDLLDTVRHRHVLARNMIQEVEHPTCGPIKLINTPVKYSYSTPGIRTPPPLLGQHTEQILKDSLGMSDIEIEELRVEGIVR